MRYLYGFLLPLLSCRNEAIDVSSKKVDTSEDKLMKLSMSMVDDVAKTVSEFMKGYREQHADNKEGAPKVVADETPVESEEIAPAMAAYLQAMNRWGK